jgi:small subunit ribosomal protein S7
MSRRHAAQKRDTLPDPKFNDKTVAKVANLLMEDGKKSVAERIVYDALDIVVSKTKLDPVAALNTALDNVKPAVEVKSRRVGGATYQVPVEVKPNRALALAIRMLIDAARKRGEKTMAQRFASELMDAISGKGSSVKKKEDMHKMAEANKAFAHFRW